MSEVAVKIYEVKRDIQRIHLQAPVYGKDGTNQLGKWFDSATLQPVTSVRLRHYGKYAFEVAMIGEKLPEAINGPFGAIPEMHELFYHNHNYTENKRQWTANYLCTHADTTVSFVGLHVLNPQTVVRHVSIVIRFLDE